MKEYSAFIFESYEFDPAERRIELRYSLDNDIQFTETITLPKNPPFAKYEEEELDRALQALHVIGGISYYKTYCPKKIEFREYGLSSGEADFWGTVYENGLGEFFYKNEIDFEGLIRFPAQGQSLPPLNKEDRDLKKILVPIGGGKDSIVTIELLKEAGYDVTLFRMGGHPLIEECAKVSGLPMITIERTLSPTLFELNEQGALNGHIPITAYLSCLSVVTAILYGFDAVAMSNEKSASEGNVEYLGHQINHQWSKGEEFEEMFREYLAKYVTPNVAYLSVLRPFSELYIAKLFSEHPEYFSCTTSCNTNWRIQSPPPPPGEGVRGERACLEGTGGRGLWCNQCPKCAFAFAILAAYIPKDTLLTAFGKNLYDEPALIQTYKQLLGLEGFKPFECVGTPDETKAAFFLAQQRGDLDGTVAMNLFCEHILPDLGNPQELIDDVLAPRMDAQPDLVIQILAHAHI